MVDEEQASNSRFAIEGEEVSLKIGKISVLNGLNVSVERGVIYGLLGPSGCGKTTLLRCIVGRYRPNSGSIKIWGRSPGQKGLAIPGPGVGYMPQELALYPEITTEETLTYFGRIFEMSEDDIKERISFLVELLEIPDKKIQIKKLSGGEKRRVSFATALVHKPPLVLLDEPTVGVDPLLRKSIWDYLQRLANVDSITIIVTTHYVEEARQAHIVGLMQDGRLLAEANPEYLITKHNALTLEDVFLNLCEENAKQIENQNGGTMVEGSHEENADSCEDVWVPQTPERPCNSQRMSTEESDHKEELLNGLLQKELVLNQDQGTLTVLKRSSGRMRALLTKNFIRAKRNIPLVIAQILMPTIQAIVFCWCIGGEPFDLPLAIVNLEIDPSGKSKFFLEHLDSHTIRQIPYANFTSAIESVEAGENWGVLYIGSTFTDSLINRYLEGVKVDNETIEASSIQIYLDMTSQQVALTLQTKLFEGYYDFARDMARQYHQNPLLADPPLVLGTPVYGHEKPDFVEFMAPGMMLSLIYIMSICLTSMVIILEKKEGILERSFIAGVQIWEVIASLFCPLFVMMMFQVAAVLICTLLVFSIPCLGSPIWVIIASFLAGLEGISFGLLISSISKDENTGFMFTVATFYPTCILSGIIWPLEAMPYLLKLLSYCLPLTFLIHTTRSVLSRGWSIMDHGIWDGYAIAILWIVPVIILSGVFFKYKK